MNAPDQIDQSDQTLMHLVEEISERYRRGDSVDEPGLCKQHPEYASQLSRLFPTLQTLAELGYDPGVDDQESADKPPQSPLGDFRIKREIGRGGMGIVYEAEQLSLGRIVALKVLPFATMLGERQLQRFKNEAKAAATLTHPHIVPIYAVGTERGVHFYAMQLINGQSLAEMLEQLRAMRANDDSVPNVDRSIEATKSFLSSSARPNEGASDSAEKELIAAGQPEDVVAKSTRAMAGSSIATDRSELSSLGYFREIARLGIQAAEALQHAHDNGIVHRDIKPGNLLIDSDRQLWITDFGLAQLQRETGVTVTGDLVGTLRYMSPEQASGKYGVVDGGTDIYSLGATLYELLTLEPCFPGEDRQQLLQQISGDDAPQPRELNRSIPRELQTIVLKALAKERNGRYATAADLAEDLKCFLDNRPIQAKPPGLTQRFYKWSLRHQAAVRSIVVIALLSVIGLIVSNVLIAKQRDQARQATLTAEEEQGRAEANLQLALQAVNEMMDRLANEQLENAPGMQALRAEVTDRAVQLLEKLATQNPRNQALQAQVAAGHLRLGRLLQVIGKHKLSEEALHKAAALYDELCRVEDHSPAVHVERARCADYQGTLLRDLGRFDEAQTAYRSVSELLEPVAENVVVKHARERLLAVSRQNLARILADQNKFSDAEAEYRRALNLHEKIVESSDEFSDQYDFAMTLLNLGVLQFKTSEFAAAEDSTQKAISIFEELSNRQPSNSGLCEQLALANNNLAMVYWETARQDLSEKAFRDEVTILKTLADQYPNVPDYQDDLAVVYGNLGVVLRKKSDTDGATAAAQSAVSLLEKLVSKHSKVIEYRLHLASYSNNLANCLKDQGELKSALKLYQKAVALNEGVVATHPSVTEYFEYLARHQKNLADALWEDAQLNESVQILQRMTVELAKVAEQRPENIPDGRRLAQAWWTLGDRHLQLEQYEEAEAAYGTAISLREEASERFSSDVSLVVDVAHRRGLFASQLRNKFPGEDRKHRAYSEIEQAIEQLSESMSDVSDNGKLRLILAALTCDYGTMLKSDGRETEALAAYSKSVETLENPISQNMLAWFLLTCDDPSLRDHERALVLAGNAVQAKPDRPAYQNTLALAYYRCGKFDKVLSLTPATDQFDCDEKILHHVLRTLSFYRLGHTTKARQQFAIAKDLMGKGSVTDRAAQKLVEEAQTLLIDVVEQF